MIYTEKRSSFWLTLVAALTLTYFAVLPVYGAETVNTNRADVSTLASQLVGVGPQLAKRIVEFRERYGAFKSCQMCGESGPYYLKKMSTELCSSKIEMGRFFAPFSVDLVACAPQNGGSVDNGLRCF